MPPMSCYEDFRRLRLRLKPDKKRSKTSPGCRQQRSVELNQPTVPPPPRSPGKKKGQRKVERDRSRDPRCRRSCSFLLETQRGPPPAPRRASQSTGQTTARRAGARSNENWRVAPKLRQDGTHLVVEGQVEEGPNLTRKTRKRKNQQAKVTRTSAETKVPGKRSKRDNGTAGCEVGIQEPVASEADRRQRGRKEEDREVRRDVVPAGTAGCGMEKEEDPTSRGSVPSVAL